MIKARGTMADGRHMIILGLSEGNLTNLRNGMPIFIDLRDIGLETGKVCIFWGETEDAIAEDFERVFGPMPRNDQRPPDARPSDVKPTEGKP